MAIEKYSGTWITGFAEEASRLGLDREGASTLLKFAAMYENAADPRFQEGFKQASAMTKTAAPGGGILAGMGDLAGKMFSGATSTTGGAMATGAAGVLAPILAYEGLWRPHVNKGPFEQEAQALRDAVDYGFLTEDQANIAGIQLRKRYADQHLGGTGYSSTGPRGGYGWNQSMA